MSISVRFAKMRPEAMLPTYASEGAAGLDLSAAIKEPVTLEPGERAGIPTGLAILFPPGYEGQVRPRSGLALRHGIGIVNSPGTVDEDYRGEVRVLLINLGKAPFVVEPGQRIAQLVVTPVVKVDVSECQMSDMLPTARGDGGFGSTGR